MASRSPATQPEGGSTSLRKRTQRRSSRSSASQTQSACRPRCMRRSTRVTSTRGAVDPADLNVDSVLGSIGYMATRTMPWYLSVYGILSTVARPSAASPNAPTPAVRAACAHASQGRLSVIVVSIVSGKPGDPQPAPILRLKLLSKLSKGRAAGRAAALRGPGSTPLRTHHRPTHPTNSPDRDSGRHGVPNRT